MADDYAEKLETRHRFLSELHDLFHKYNASLDIDVMCRGYHHWYADMTIDLDRLDNHCGEISDVSRVSAADIQHLRNEAYLELRKWNFLHPQ